MLRRLGTLYGAIIGALAYLLLDEWLSGLTENWKVIFGPLLVAGRAVRARRARRRPLCEREGAP